MAACRYSFNDHLHCIQRGMHRSIRITSKRMFWKSLIVRRSYRCIQISHWFKEPIEKRKKSIVSDKRHWELVNGCCSRFKVEFNWLAVETKKKLEKLQLRAHSEMWKRSKSEQNKLIMPQPPVHVVWRALTNKNRVKNKYPHTKKIDNILSIISHKSKTHTWPSNTVLDQSPVFRLKTRHIREK